MDPEDWWLRSKQRRATEERGQQMEAELEASARRLADLEEEARLAAEAAAAEEAHLAEEMERAEESWAAADREQQKREDLERRLTEVQREILVTMTDTN